MASENSVAIGASAADPVQSAQQQQALQQQITQQSSTPAPQPAPQPANAPAVISSSSDSDADAQTAPAANAKAAPVTREQAEKVAAQIKDALNSSSNAPAGGDQTEIRFNVSLVGNQKDKNSFSFQVIDSETGKVIRQFPPEDILDLKDRVSATPPSPGVLLDSRA